jgi:hypothetical protein
LWHVVTGHERQLSCWIFYTLTVRFWHEPAGHVAILTAEKQLFIYSFGAMLAQWMVDDAFVGVSQVWITERFDLKPI